MHKETLNTNCEEGQKEATHARSSTTHVTLFTLRLLFCVKRIVIDTAHFLRHPYLKSLAACPSVGWAIQKNLTDTLYSSAVKALAKCRPSQLGS